MKHYYSKEWLVVSWLVAPTIQLTCEKYDAKNAKIAKKLKNFTARMMNGCNDSSSKSIVVI
jgi:hypothetical protein